MAQPVTKLAELGNSWRNYDVIGIDEGQFYSDVSPLDEVKEWFSTYSLYSLGCIDHVCVGC